MSIKSCNRLGCSTISSCDRYSTTFGYICNECFSELTKYNYISIEKFMNTRKRSASSEKSWSIICHTEFKDKCNLNTV